MRVRIQKLLADAGVESRRHVEEMVVQARISVNGKLVTRLPVMVDPAVDKITIDGEPVAIPTTPAESKKIYILMNKPSGVYCTNVAQGEQRRAIDLLPPEIDKRIYPVGRLDADSRGLLLLTNDGDLTQKLTHPKFGVAKSYTCVVDGYVKPETVERMAEGIWLADPEKGGFKTGRTQIKVVKRATRSSVLQITIREGRNRQVRRMLAAVGHKVRELTRVKIGPLELGRLKPGAFRFLSPFEIKSLMEAIKPKPPVDPKALGGAALRHAIRDAKDRPERAGRPERAERSDRPERPKRPAKPSRPISGKGSAKKRQTGYRKPARGR
ncbi:MAG: pseudouridine synthase [Phycisphaerales bacterium]|nr:pseudouridine synthase [Phycisphaerales bacterium]